MDLWISLIDKPTQTLELVSLLDPAIDSDATTEEMLGTYERTHDRTRLAYKAGKAPIVFHVETLSDAALDAVEVQTMSTVRILPGGVRVQATATTVLHQIFAAVCRRVVAPVWDPEGGRRVGEVPRERWNRIPVEMRIDVARQVRDLSLSPEVPPESDPGN